MTGDEAPTGPMADDGTAEDLADMPSPEAPDTPAAPADDRDEGGPAGAASNDDPDAASDGYGHHDTLIGDLTDPDVDLGYLTPDDDGDPDDDEDPSPASAETVEQDPTGQAVIDGEDDPEPDDADDVQEPTA